MSALLHAYGFLFLLLDERLKEISLGLDDELGPQL